LVATAQLRLTESLYLYLGTDVNGVSAVAVVVAPHAVAVHAVAGVTFVSSIPAVSIVSLLSAVCTTYECFSQSHTRL
jgi:hypothetical protein